MSVPLPDSSAGCLVLNINLRYIGAERTKIGIAASENMPIAETLLLRQYTSLSLGDSQ
jgi:hypothetical protein